MPYLNLKLPTKQWEETNKNKVEWPHKTESLSFMRMFNISPPVSTRITFWKGLTSWDILKFGRFEAYVVKQDISFEGGCTKHLLFRRLMLNASENSFKGSSAGKGVVKFQMEKLYALLNCRNLPKMESICYIWEKNDRLSCRTESLRTTVF